MSGRHVIFSFGGSSGFQGVLDWNFTVASSDGIDLALQRFDPFLDGNDAMELACR